MKRASPTDHNGAERVMKRRQHATQAGEHMSTQQELNQRDEVRVESRLPERSSGAANAKDEHVTRARDEHKKLQEEDEDEDDDSSIYSEDDDEDDEYGQFAEVEDPIATAAPAARATDRVPANAVKPSPNPYFYDGLYAPSGFDMMGILLRVATRSNPIIDIGMVDTNCALVLCDTFQPDCPIVYCSEGFEALTGYKQEEILGRNCRFLQKPPAVPIETESSRRNTAATSRYTSHKVQELDLAALADFKAQIMSGNEAQITVTNYTRWGAPFTNILTAIPLSWDTAPAERKRYIVGFQVNREAVFINR
ncbi:hypothetical protein AAFC00_002409 [Neodothiora populina]